MIIGAHSILYSARPEADRAFLRDVLGLPSVDVGEGWLIFGVPPAELAVHLVGRERRPRGTVRFRIRRIPGRNEDADPLDP